VAADVGAVRKTLILAVVDVVDQVVLLHPGQKIVCSQAFARVLRVGKIFIDDKDIHHAFSIVDAC
jgi:hypothetical protein